MKKGIPIMTSRELSFPNPYASPMQAWIETLSTHDDVKHGLMDIHPDVFGVQPR